MANEGNATPATAPASGPSLCAASSPTPEPAKPEPIPDPTGPEPTALSPHEEACRELTARGGKGGTIIPATWEAILTYGDDQAGEAAAGRGPKRSPDVEERYRRYTRWCAERGHTGVELVLATSIWRAAEFPDDGGPVWVALEPNIVPYHCAEGIE